MHRTKSRKKGKGRKIVGIIVLAISIFLILGIITGDKFLRESGNYIHTYFLGYTFGYSVLIIPVLLLCYGWYVFFRKSISSLFKLSLYLLILMVLISYGLSFLNSMLNGKFGDALNLGGFAGLFIADKSREFLGNFGTIIVLITVYLIFIFSIFDIEIGEKYRSVEERIKKLFGNIKKTIGKKYYRRKKILKWKKKEKKEYKKPELVENGNLNEIIHGAGFSGGDNDATPDDS